MNEDQSQARYVLRLPQNATYDEHDALDVSKKRRCIVQGVKREVEQDLRGVVTKSSGRLFGLSLEPPSLIFARVISKAVTRTDEKDLLTLYADEVTSKTPFNLQFLRILIHQPFKHLPPTWQRRSAREICSRIVPVLREPTRTLPINNAGNLPVFPEDIVRT